MPPSNVKRVKVPASRSNQRVRGVSIFRPIIYGNTAHPIDPDNRPRGMPADHTHLWTISVRGVDDDLDITHFIKKVQFKLHADTYSNPNRTFESPPFEVTESGWGEFEIQIKLFFHPESNEKPLTLFHYLKLHPYHGDEAAIELARKRREDVTSYTYDELVFNEPAEAMFDILTSKGSAQLPQGRGGFTAETEAREIDRLSKGLRIVQEHITSVREKLAQQEQDVAEMRKALVNKRALVNNNNKR